MPSILNIYVNATSGNIILSDEIKTEHMTLKCYKAQFSSDANSESAGMLVFKTSWINTGSIISGSNSFQTYPLEGLILPLDKSEITVNSCDMNFDVSSVIPNNFNYQIFGGNSLAGFEGLTLVFEYQTEDELTTN